MTILDAFFRSTNSKLIAEVSANHGGNLDNLLALTNKIADAGAHAIKLQTFEPEEMTINSRHADFSIQDPSSPWNGRRLYDLYLQGQTPKSWHKPVFDLARERGMVGFSSVFGLKSLEFLESINVPIYKIASFENIDLILLREVAKTGKPVFMSTGMINLQELEKSVNALLESGVKKLVLFGCTSNYPASAKEVNLNAIPFLRSTFGVEVGYSDHTLGNTVAIAAVAMGARYIEKHVKLPGDTLSLDSEFALETSQLEVLVRSMHEVDLATQNRVFGPAQSEISPRKRRRGLFFCKPMKAGDVIKSENVRTARPMLGISAIDIDEVLGRRVNFDVQQNDPITRESLI
jgi:pseudaminic acid synthase